MIKRAEFWKWLEWNRNILFSLEHITPYYYSICRKGYGKGWHICSILSFTANQIVHHIPEWAHLGRFCYFPVLAVSLSWKTIYELFVGFQNYTGFRVSRVHHRKFSKVFKSNWRVYRPSVLTQKLIWHLLLINFRSFFSVKVVSNFYLSFFFFSFFSYLDEMYFISFCIVYFLHAYSLKVPFIITREIPK